MPIAVNKTKTLLPFIVSHTLHTCNTHAIYTMLGSSSLSKAQLIANIRGSHTCIRSIQASLRWFCGLKGDARNANIEVALST